MNILFVSDVSIAEVIGGAERVLFEQSAILQNRGHDVHILTRKLPVHKSDHQIIQGVNEWRYDVDQSNVCSFIISTLLNSKRLFESLQNQYSFCFINFHQPFSALGVIRSPACKKVGKIYTCHSLSFEEFKSRNPQPNGLAMRGLYTMNWRLRRAAEKNILKRSDKIVVLSEFTREKLLHHYGINDRKITIIPGGVDLLRFKPSIQKTTIRKKLNIPAKKIVLFTVRNLVARMGLENLLRAVSKVAHQIPELYLVIGGAGPLKEHLISLAQGLSIQDHVRFAGFIKEENLPSYYQMADLFVLPTKELEGFGLTTLEALASGLPVVGTPVGGTKEILNKLDPDLLFRGISADAMAAGILRMVLRLKGNKELKESLSRQCRRFVETHYSWDDKIDSLERLFRQH